MSISPQSDGAAREAFAGHRDGAEPANESPQLEPILQELRDIDGVRGALIVDRAAGVLAYRAHASYAPPVLQQIARAIGSATDSVQGLEDDWESLTAEFGAGKLVLRNLRTASAQSRRCVLAVVADSTRDVGFLGVALRIAASRLILVLEAAPSLVPESAPTPGPTGTGQQAACELVESELVDDPDTEAYPWWTS
jgi:predicted regulator of Ras-like GTPase activity (Roadblock/LC7/MglB family)